MAGLTYVVLPFLYLPVCNAITCHGNTAVPAFGALARFGKPFTVGKNKPALSATERLDHQFFSPGFKGLLNIFQVMGHVFFADPNRLG